MERDWFFDLRFATLHYGRRTEKREKNSQFNLSCQIAPPHTALELVNTNRLEVFNFVEVQIIKIEMELKTRYIY